ncbi:MAG: protease inhibitor I42 family protein [Candidatus Omnitrophica bacterium]|nr:protease inhibitor I42 family protein [Candidatus Omnitrophota bacterium]
MKKIAVLVIGIICVLQLTGCKGQIAQKETILRVDSNKGVTLGVGEILEIRLDSNPTTGYIWQCSHIGAKAPIKDIGTEYTSQAKAIGAGGTRIYRFKAVKPGEEKVYFEYSRPWEKEVDPAKRYFVKISVQ